MSTPSSWRELLGNIIADPHVREHIASAIGVHPVTLTRWVNQETQPRQQSLRRLIEVAPAHTQELLTLINEEFPDLSLNHSSPGHGRPEEQAIAVTFYARVLHTLAVIPSQLCFPLLCELIAQQALDHLDPFRAGMAIIVARCMPPSKAGIIQSLRESEGRGSPPWPDNPESHGVFLGAESLAGQAIISGHLEVNQGLRQHANLAPGYKGPWEESAAAAPLLHTGGVAGAVLVFSRVPNYFTPERCSLVEQYAELLSLAFASSEFFPLTLIHLSVMPPAERQRPHLSRFRSRVNVVMKEALHNQQPLTITQAEQIIWQRMEEELLTGNY